MVKLVSLGFSQGIIVTDQSWDLQLERQINALVNKEEKVYSKEDED